MRFPSDTPNPGSRRFHHPGPGHEGGRGLGPGHGRSGRRGGRGRGRGRAPRGDVRAAVLLLLAQEPMHGYQLMGAIADRSGGRWRPSPGAIYPVLAQLEDEGLVSVTAESGRKVAALTDAGREAVAAAGEDDPFTAYDEAPDGPDLRDVMGQLVGAVRQVARTGSPAQVEAAAGILAEARRSLYLLLADGPEAADAAEPSAG